MELINEKESHSSWSPLIKRDVIKIRSNADLIIKKFPVATSKIQVKKRTFFHTRWSITILFEEGKENMNVS